MLDDVKIDYFDLDRTEFDFDCNDKFLEMNFPKLTRIYRFIDFQVLKLCKPSNK